MRRLNPTMSGSIGRGRHFSALVAILVSFAAGRWASPPLASERPSRWTPAAVVSANNESWFPDVTLDVNGRAHVIWASGNGLNYRAWNGRTWSAVTDLTTVIGASHQSRGDVVRAAVAADRKGSLHLFGTMLNNGTGNYSRANADRAVNRSAWSRHARIGENGAGYYSALQVDGRNRVHAVYVGRPQDSLLADTYYRHATDGGVTWSTPVNLSRSPGAGSSRPQLLVDGANRLHVSWDEGWDRQTGKGTIHTSLYRWSGDGLHWSETRTFGGADLPSAQLVVGSGDAARTRLAVWRSSQNDRVYFQQSVDDDTTWTAPTPVPGVGARSWNSPPFDQYAMAADATGRVHLVIVGLVQEPRPRPLQLIHLVWMNGQWQQPEIVFQVDGLFPEYPRLAVGPHGELHVVWFTRQVLWTQGPRVIWHSTRPS